VAVGAREPSPWPWVAPAWIVRGPGTAALARIDAARSGAGSGDDGITACAGAARDAIERVFDACAVGVADTDASAVACRCAWDAAGERVSCSVVIGVACATKVADAIGVGIAAGMRSVASARAEMTARRRCPHESESRATAECACEVEDQMCLCVATAR
jgi:hypothetical protein